MTDQVVLILLGAALLGAPVMGALIGAVLSVSAGRSRRRH